MNRRSLTKALLTGGALLPFASTRGLLLGGPAQAAENSLVLSAVTRTLDIDGRAATVFGLAGPDGSPGLSLRASEMVRIDLTNALAEPTMIHWHGLTPPWEGDGVPDAPMPLLQAGETRGYFLPTGRPGTHWMHAHTLQEQQLLAAPLIVRGEEDLVRDEQDVVVLLHDFSFTPPGELLTRLQAGGGHGAGAAALMAGMDHSGMDMGGADMAGMDHSAMSGMGAGAMATMDLNDIEYDAYLANDRTLNDPEVVQVEIGGRVRLRIINGATATGFTIDTGMLAGEVIAVDGQDVEPFAATRFPLSMGQRVDFRLRLPAEGGAFPILALREGAPQRAGLILATPGAQVTRVAVEAETAGPVLSLDEEARLVSLRPLTGRAVDCPFHAELTGDMAGYRWGIETSGPMEVALGQRVEIAMNNTSMMAHPMHLHGHHFQVVAIDDQPFRGALRDTVLVPPGRSVTIAFDATNIGASWAFHCHHLYHMAAGMMANVTYREA